MEIRNIRVQDISPNTGQLEGLPKNPRFIRDERFDALRKSIEDAPEMLSLRELLVFPHKGKYVAIGGNMRLRACRDIGYAELPCKVLDPGTPVDKLREYAIKDNESFGQYDFGALVDEWDTDELQRWGVELQGFEDRDTGSPFEFDTEATTATDDKKDEDGRYYGDERERTYNLVNLREFDAKRCDGFYQIPTIDPCDYVPESLIGFNYVKSDTAHKDTVHFFIDDYQFERVWNNPLVSIERLKDFPATLTPDFSLYMDMPMAMKIWNVYRSRLFGQMCQGAGMKVIPTLSWAEPETFSFCFDGLKPGGVVAVSTVGVMNDKNAREVFRSGMDEAIKRLKPSCVICYGSKIDYEFGDVKVKYIEARRFG
jgi:hypothetical protein